MSIPQTPSPLANIIASKTYNAAWFSGATKEAQITAAIAAAVTDGALYVYVPASMLPYTASAVTFNNAVRMIREGGDHSNFDVRAYGAAGNSTQDDTVSIQACVTAAVAAQGTVYFSRSVANYTLTSAIAITGQVTIRGEGQFAAGLLCFNCGAFVISAGANGVHIEKLYLANTSRYTQVINNLVGILVNGTTGSRPQQFIFRDLFIDGFKFGFQTNYLWSTTFDQVEVNGCYIGLEAAGLSVNNVVTNCGFTGGAGISQIGIHFTNVATEVSEGWMISNTLIDSFDYGIMGENTAHIYISNCIIDHNNLVGIWMVYTGPTYASLDWGITNNYIGVSGVAAVAAIYDNNINLAQDAQCRGHMISGNLLLCYVAGGAHCDRGIDIRGTGGRRSTISDNTIRDFALNDIAALNGDVGAVIVGNSCESTIALAGTNANVWGGRISMGNSGSQYYERSSQYGSIGMVRITYDEASPAVVSTQAWNRGDRCFNITAAVGSPKGWVCTVAGTPGTWVSEGNL